MSSTLDRLHGDAKTILNSVWNLAPGAHALVAYRWFKSAEGFEAFAAYALQMNAAQGVDAEALVTEIFALKVEIAARQRGWCLEMDSAMGPRDLTTDSQ